MLNIVVCVKVVYDVGGLRVDQTGNLLTEGVPRKISDVDINAVEEALRLKEKYGAKVNVIAAGSLVDERPIREVLAMGADAAYCISDKAIGKFDTYLTSLILAKTIEKIKPFDLILVGEASIDTGTSQIGPRLAEVLDIPILTYARKVWLENGQLFVERDLEDGYEVKKATLPALVTVVKEINEPRIPTLLMIMAASKKQLLKLSLKDIGLSSSELQEPCINVEKLVPLKKERKKVLLKGPKEEVVEKLLTLLRKEGIIKG
jgi:electron transfer flavoprotein beta subunit